MFRGARDGFELVRLLVLVCLPSFADARSFEIIRRGTAINKAVLPGRSD
jgi:hypothetical protein